MYTKCSLLHKSNDDERRSYHPLRMDLVPAEILIDEIVGGSGSSALLMWCISLGLITKHVSYALFQCTSVAGTSIRWLLAWVMENILICYWIKIHAFLHELDLLTHKLNSEELWMETFAVCLKFSIDKPHKKCTFRSIARNSRSLDAYGKLF